MTTFLQFFLAVVLSNSTCHAIEIAGPFEKIAVQRLENFLKFGEEQGLITAKVEAKKSSFVEAVYTGFMDNIDDDEGYGKRAAIFLASLKLLGISSVQQTSNYTVADFFKNLFLVFSGSPDEDLDKISIENFGFISLKSILAHANKLQILGSDDKFDLIFETNCNSTCLFKGSDLRAPSGFISASSASINQKVILHYNFRSWEVRSNLENYKIAKHLPRTDSVPEIVSTLDEKMSYVRSDGPVGYSTYSRPPFSLAVEGLSVSVKVGRILSGRASDFSFVIINNSARTWGLSLFNADIASVVSGQYAVGN